MTRDSDFIGILEEYLDEFDGSTPLPAQSRHFVRARLTSIQQRPAWLAGWRFTAMNNTVRIGLAGAAAVVVALLGIQYLAPGSTVGGPRPASPTVAPTPSSSEAATIVIGEGLIEHARVTTPMPEGWTLEANFANKDGTASDGMGFSAWTSTGVHADPCNWQDDDMDPSAASTVDEIVGGLVAQPGRDPRTPTQVTLGGWSATRIELVTPASLDISTCDEGRYKAWTDLSDPSGGNWNHQSGQFDVVYVVDVDSGPVVIDAWYNASTSEADLGELESLLAAMVIDSQ